jgi:hypothetical protein
MQEIVADDLIALARRTLQRKPVDNLDPAALGMDGTALFQHPSSEDRNECVMQNSVKEVRSRVVSIQREQRCFNECSALQAPVRKLLIKSA